MIEKAGADALTIHARLAIHGGKIPADWSWINKVKKEIGIPVIGNGDIFSGNDAGKMLEIADGCMIARAAIGNPFIFREIIRYLKSGKEKGITKRERINSFLNYIKLAKNYDIVDLARVKHLGPGFFRGFDGAAKMREEFMKLKNLKEITEFFGNI